MPPSIPNFGQSPQQPDSTPQAEPTTFDHGFEDEPAQEPDDEPTEMEVMKSDIQFLLSQVKDTGSASTEQRTRIGQAADNAYEERANAQREQEGN